MNATKKQYLSAIRSNTAYPTYRAFIEVFIILGNILAVLSGVAIFFRGVDREFPFVLAAILGILIAALIYFCIRLCKEAALILVDIADSILDTNSRTHSGQ